MVERGHRGTLFGLSLVLIVLACAGAMPTDVVDVGETAEEAILGLDDLSSEDSDPNGMTPQSDSPELGDTAGFDLSTLNDRVAPRPLEPPVSPDANDKATKAINIMLESLKNAQNKGIAAQVKADKKDKEANELERLASVKDDKKKQELMVRRSIVLKQASKQRLKADKLQTEALELKLGMKAHIKKMQEVNSEKYEKAHFDATKAEVNRAEALTKLNIAKKPKLVPLDPCDITYEHSAEGCRDTTKTHQAAAGTGAEMEPKKIEEEEKSCTSAAAKMQTKCKDASLQEMTTESAASHTLAELGKATTNRAHAMRLAAALQSYKDVVKPKEPDGPVGLFQFKGLVFMANKDGTRTWVRYPTYKCGRATAGIPQQQFPQSLDSPEFDAVKSKVACEMGVYKGTGNPDFYDNCECSGMSNKKGHGAFCEDWGYKFKWCYVARECGYGNTAFSDEVKDSKVLVGCRIHAPLIEP